MWLAHGQLALSMALVGANVAVAKALAEALPIPLIAFLRCLVALIVLWPLAWLREGRSWPAAPLLGNLALQALFGTVLYNVAMLSGLRLTTALEGGLVLATLPAVVAVGATFWLGERLTLRQGMAVVLAVVAMAALTVAGGETAASRGGSVLGNLLVFAAVIGEAGYVLLARRIAGRLGVLTASLWMQSFSAVLLAPLALPALSAAAAVAVPGMMALLVFHALTASVLCLLLWYAGLKHVPASIAGIYTLLLPTTASLVAIGVLGEALTRAHAVGLVLMLASVLLAAWPQRRGV